MVLVAPCGEGGALRVRVHSLGGASHTTSLFGENLLHAKAWCFRAVAGTLSIAFHFVASAAQVGCSSKRGR